MLEQSTEVERSSLSLTERKQRAARERIISAADSLFAERGFTAVSVTDIAERAEVGRSTFFRHFGDKTEVVFAKEQAVFDAIPAAASKAWTSLSPVDTLASALVALEPLVLQLCAKATEDPDSYLRHLALVDAHDELKSREAVKHQFIASELTKALVERATPLDVATLAGQLAVACYEAGRLLTDTPDDLSEGVRSAFRRTLAMHTAEPAPH